MKRTLAQQHPLPHLPSLPEVDQASLTPMGELNRASTELADAVARRSFGDGSTLEVLLAGRKLKTIAAQLAADPLLRLDRM